MAETLEAKRATTFKLLSIKVGVIPVKTDDGSYIPAGYVCERYSKEETSIVSFGSSKEKEETYVIFRNEMLQLMDPIKKENVSFFEPLYDGLDALHASVEATAIDELTRDLSEKKKLEAKTALSSNEKFPKNTIMASPKKLYEDGYEFFDKTVTMLQEDKIALVKKEIKKQLSLFAGTSSSSVGSVDENLLERYAFTKNIMLVGDAGEGKTFLLSSWINRKQKEDGYAYYHADGHEGFEIPDMLGMMVPNEAGGMSWIDGPVTQAFRSAARGVKTVLFMDEILRIPDKERSLLIGALVPKADGFLSMRTNRIMGYDADGIGDTEEIKCLPENLWVVAASNIGTKQNNQFAA